MASIEQVAQAIQRSVEEGLAGQDRRQAIPPELYGRVVRLFVELGGDPAEINQTWREETTDEKARREGLEAHRRKLADLSDHRHRIDCLTAGLDEFGNQIY